MDANISFDFDGCLASKSNNEIEYDFDSIWFGNKQYKSTYEWFWCILIWPVASQPIGNKIQIISFDSNLTSITN